MKNRSLTHIYIKRYFNKLRENIPDIQWIQLKMLERFEGSRGGLTFLQQINERERERERWKERDRERENFFYYSK